ncbi:MAG TPA: deoxyribodipyrimidine photo-lyase [Solimonas sp.]|nr:deoxyribodipyrimidine photo-lyase [Solimonas sp.]
MSLALVWFRRDLRLTDNPALQQALERHPQVLPVYIDDPASETPWSPGGASRWWLHHSLQALGEALARRGNPLVLRRGASLDALRDLVRDTGASAVYWNRLYEPAAISRDQAIKQALRADGLEVQSHNGALWREPWELKTGGGEPYRVFTPFWRKLGAELPPLRITPAPEQIPGPDRRPDALPLSALGLLPRIPWDAEFPAHWQPGEAGAHATLQRFLDEGLAGYHGRRDFPALGNCSRLSPHLHFGEIGPQQIRAAVLREQAQAPSIAADAEHYLRELGWREFGHHLLYHFPATPATPMYERFAAFPWREPGEYGSDLQAWQRGQTGIPIVDAGMRQLWRSGWMHNRVRMIVASLLTKNLLIPWQEGANWFWDTLVDASLANNTLGWQWAAGCGADAAPYFRIFNPLLQSQKFDPEGVYLRRWVPELAALPTEALHAPWLAAPGTLARAGVQLGSSYPRPIIDLAASRDRALAAYDRLKAAETAPG